ncbi:MAG TPA: carbamoyltransferase C-terminal domain-containing protein [Tepidisphaeraceae bacterium]|jgi:carbamoyltransferase|nr:carbamoyltransferase C-terminal domain-containing protein [Tepidisphaeraceae bacterium]
MAQRAPIAILIPTKNEEINLPFALASVADWAQQVFVLDCGSTDRTAQIAIQYGAQVVDHPWEGYARQKNWGLDNLPIITPWVFILDADEVITPRLREELTKIATANTAPEDGFYINRYLIFLDKRLRHSGYYPSWNIRFFRHGKARYEERRVHEHMIVSGRVGYIKNGEMEHHDRRGLEHFIAKHNHYSTLEAQEIFRIQQDLATGTISFGFWNGPVERRRWIKHKIWHRLPARWFVRFLSMYILQLGFLDGRAGFHLAFLLAVYEHQISLKLQELWKKPRKDLRGAKVVETAPPPAAPGAISIPVPDNGKAAYSSAPSSNGNSIIIGLNVFHGDASAAALSGGQFRVGVEEERFTRIKHWAGFPENALKHCASEVNGGSLEGVAALAVSRQPQAYFLRKVLLALSHPRSLPRAANRVRNMTQIRSLQDRVGRAFSFPREKLPPLYAVEHHLAHIASAFYCSPYDQAMCLTVDGFGDFVSTMLAVGRGNSIDVLQRVHYPHSLGLFYTAITQYLGFPKYGDEYKVMGLAAYGEPSLADKLREMVPPQPDGTFKLNLRYFRHLREGVDMTWENGEPQLGPVYSDQLQQLLGQPPRDSRAELTQWHKDMAASLQKVYEERFFSLVRTLSARTGMKKLTLAGGCALNSLANGKLFDQTDIQEVYIQAASADGGTSLGAALYVQHAILNQPRSFIMEHAYWGPEYTDEDIRLAVASGVSGSGGANGAYGDLNVETFEDESALLKETAAAIAAGEVVGWYQGRSEWGPRALGNRSILADPRRNDMRDILNLKIKRREAFRPFAPSILEEETGNWFTISYPDPFMLKVYPIRPEKRALIPAVCHADGTGRLQTVSPRTNPRYYRLIKEFFRQTGVPTVLNTSFNENEPIVNTPAQALDCFLRTKMDRIVMGSTVVSRKSQPAPALQASAAAS